MGLQSDIFGVLDSLKTSLPDVISDVIYKGVTFEAFTLARSIKGNPAPFGEGENGESKLIAKSTDIESKPERGDPISVDGENRLILDAKLDPVGASYSITHEAAYETWANLYNDQDTPDSSTIYERVRVRVMDANEGDFTQFPDGDFTLDQYVVALRRAEWPQDSIPSVGWVLDFDGERDNLYISTVIIQSGDIRMMCREDGV